MTHKYMTGNYVQPKDKPVMIVVGINSCELELYMPGSEADPWTVDIEDVEGVLITPGWLKRLGFEEKRKGAWYRGRLQWNGHLVFLKNEDTEECYYIPTIVDYVHQLQNLFGWMTGEEITAERDVTSALQEKLQQITPPTPINTWGEFHALEVQIQNGLRERQITGRDHTDYEVADIWKKNEWIRRQKNQVPMVR